MKIIWLIGKSVNVDIIWSAYTYKSLVNLETLRNTNLFEDEQNYKYIYNKKDNKFFTHNKLNRNSELIIKGISKTDKELMKTQDTVLLIDDMKTQDLFALYIKITKTNFNEQEENLLSKINSLEELMTIINLKTLQIPIIHWHHFLSKAKDNWYLEHKQNNLLALGIKNPTQIIPIMSYEISLKHKQKAPLLFLQAKIKQGYQIWELNQLWKSIIA